jgi:hypothetical protein
VGPGLEHNSGIYHAQEYDADKTLEGSRDSGSNGGSSGPAPRSHSATPGHSESLSWRDGGTWPTEHRPARSGYKFLDSET